MELDVRTLVRLAEPVEVAAYYAVAEALTNVAKHANASFVRVEADVVDGYLRILVQDDGVGGANPGRGSGLVGLADRVEAIGGKLTVDSPPAGGTTLRIDLPLSGVEAMGGTLTLGSPPAGGTTPHVDLPSSSNQADVTDPTYWFG